MRLTSREKYKGKNEGQTSSLNWFIAPFLLIAVLFAVTQYSNVDTHLALLQKPGNYHDDSVLTNSLRKSDSLQAVLADLRWGYEVVAPAYYLNHFFSIETKGRQIIAVVILWSSLIYLLVLLARYQVLDNFGLLLFAFLFATSGGLTTYASTGLLSYPLLILFSVIHIHLLLLYHDRRLSIRSYLVICIIFTLTVLVNSRAVIGVCAVSFALAFANVFQNPVSFSDLLVRFRRLVTLVTVPASAAILYLFFYTPVGLINPNRGLEFYFFKSSFPDTFTGAAHFYSQNTATLYLSAMSPHPFVTRPVPAIWVGLLLGIFFLVGLIRCRNQKAFGFVLYFLAGSLSIIILNLASIAPYGNLRYFLPFVIAYPVLTALGITQAVRWFQTLVLRRHDMLGIVYKITAIIMLAVLLQYQYANKKYNTTTKDKLAQGISLATKAREENDAAIVVDIWTADTLQAEKWAIADEISYGLKTHIKTAWRGNLSENVDDIEKWGAFLQDQKSFITITSVQFSKKYYGPLYEAAFEDFEIVNLSSVPVYHFAEFTRREDTTGR